MRAAYAYAVSAVGLTTFLQLDVSAADVPQRALAPPPAVSIRLDESFPPGVRGDLQRVAEDVLRVTRALFDGEPPAGSRPIVCYYRGPGPMTDSTSDPSRYRVGLSVRNRGYTQFVYQLAHELGHVYLDPRRTNGLLETLAVAVSHDVLDRMSDAWARQPPYPNWRSYAPEFRRYRERNELRHLRAFPEEIQRAVRGGDWSAVSRYLAERRRDQDSNPIDRNLNVLGAIALRAQAVAWSRYRGLGSHTQPPPQADGRFRDDLFIDATQLVTLSADMSRIGRR